MSELKQCQAKTLNGNQCSFNAKKDQRYCGMHENYNYNNDEKALIDDLENIVANYTDIETYEKLMQNNPDKYTEKKLRNNLIESIPTNTLSRLNLAKQLADNYFKLQENSDTWDHYFQYYTADKINPEFLTGIIFLYLSSGFTDIKSNLLFQEIDQRVQDQRILIDNIYDELYNEIKNSIDKKEDIWSEKPKYYYKRIFEDVYFDTINNDDTLYFTDIPDEKLKKRIKEKFIEEIYSGEDSLYEYQTGFEYNESSDSSEDSFVNELSEEELDEESDMEDL